LEKTGAYGVVADSGAVSFITAAERGLRTRSSAAIAAAVRKRPKVASLEFGKRPAFGRQVNSARLATTREVHDVPRVHRRDAPDLSVP